MKLFKTREDCFCAFCKRPRKVYTKRGISAFNFIASLICSSVLGWVISQSWDPTSLLFFVVFLAVGEIFVQFRWRINIVCRHCGFDPVLYMKAPLQAASKVKLHLEKRKSDPIAVLSSPLDLPVLSKERALVLAQQESTLLKEKDHAAPGRLVSRQI